MSTDPHPDLPESARLLAELEDALATEPLVTAEPVLSAPPTGRAAHARRALALLGGVASARAVAGMLAEDGGPQLTVRQVREALRSRQITTLGAGYLALPDAVDRPVLPWLRARLSRLGDLPLDRIVADILDRWPHGDPAAVAAWLRQDPPGVVVIDGLVRAPRRT